MAGHPGWLLAQFESLRNHRRPNVVTSKKTGLRHLIQGLTPEAVRDGYITIQRLKGSQRTKQPLIQHEDPLLNERDP